MSFKINLIRNRVLPLEKRRAVFLTILLYLTVCSVVLVSLCYKITANFVRMSNYQEEVLRMENEFCQRHSGGKNMFDHAADMKARMVQYIKELETVDRVLSGRINLSRLLIGFSEPLPADAYIDNFSLDNSEKMLSFDVIAPAVKGEGPFNTSELISAWRDDTSLMSDIEHIKSSISQRQKKGGQSVFVSKFSCSLTKGGL